MPARFVLFYCDRDTGIMHDLDIDLDDVTFSESDGVRYLHFGTEWIQGAMSLRRPYDLVLTYTQQMMAWLLFKESHKEDEIALLGLGAGSLLRFCLKHTSSQLCTVEINPRVTAICKSFFRLSVQERSTIVHEDAEKWIAQANQTNRFDVLMVDLYDAHAQGPVCSSAEFYKSCYQSLRDDGIMSVNLFGNHASYDENIDRIEAAFNGQIMVMPEVDEGNVIVLAFKGEHLARTTTAILLDRAQVVQEQYKLPARRWAKSILSSQPKTN